MQMKAFLLSRQPNFFLFFSTLSIIPLYHRPQMRLCFCSFDYQVFTICSSTVLLDFKKNSRRTVKEHGSKSGLVLFFQFLIYLTSVILPNTLATV